MHNKRSRLGYAVRCEFLFHVSLWTKKTTTDKDDIQASIKWPR